VLSSLNFTLGRILRDIFLDNTAGKIKELSQRLLDLRTDFDTGLAIHTATVSFRIHEGVSILGDDAISLCLRLT